MKKILTILTLFTACLGAEANKNHASRVRLYKETPQGELKLHIFNPEGHKKTDAKPVIVLFPAGSWSHGAPWSQYPQAEYLAGRGVVVIVPHIRTKKHHRTDPRASVMDAKSSIRWIRSHAGELGIDPGRIAAAGGDEGGHLAAATATLDSFNEPDEARSVSCRPDALLLYNPVLDNSSQGFGHNKVKDFWDRFSPLHNIQEEMPPTLILQGTEQLQTPITGVETFKQKLEANGNRCDLVLMEGIPATFHKKERRMETMDDSIPFLASLGWITE